MGLVDDLATAVVEIADLAGIDPLEFVEAVESAEDPLEILAVLLDRIDPFGEGADILVDLLEEFILVPIEEQGELEPDEIEDALDELEGNAAAVLLGVVGLTILIEISSGGFIDEVPAEVFAAVSSLGFDEVTGRELDARLQEGIDPALKQKVHRESRSKQADFQDFTEANLRLKGVDGRIETRGGEIPAEVEALFDDRDLDHLPDLDTYGTIPAQRPLYDLTSLAHLEPEEILEEAPQKGIVPSAPAMDQAMLLSGLPEDVKEVFRDSREQVPQTEGLVQESLLVGDVLFSVDQKVIDGALTPDQATKFMEPSIRLFVRVSDAAGEPISEDITTEEAQQEVLDNLRQRFRLLASLPNDPPTQSDVDRYYRQGIISAERYQRLNERFGFEPEFFNLKLVSNSIRAGAEDIRRQNRLGRLSDSQARFRLGLIGFSAEQTAQVLAGGQPDEILAQDAAQPGSPGGAGAAILPGIGDQRSALLSQVGLGTVSDIANSSVEDLTAVTSLSNESARRAIQVAQQVAASGPPAG